MSKQNEKIWAREGKAGGFADAVRKAAGQKAPLRQFELQAKDFSSAEQAVPIRVTYGTTQSAGTYITPVFGFRSEPIKSDEGK